MKISDEIKKEVQSIVDSFNKENKSKFLVKYRGRFLYLEKITGFSSSNVGRLEFRGDMKSWRFDVYKYSSNGYDPDEWFFPGREKLDGTIEGALRAGLEIY